MLTQAFAKSLRLLNSSDYQAVFNNASIRVSHKYLLILAKPNEGDTPRLGLVIAKKNIRLAVQRNRIKRIARESFRLQQHKLAGIDAIVLARRDLNQLSNRELHLLFNRQWLRIINTQKSRQSHTKG